MKITITTSKLSRSVWVCVFLLFLSSCENQGPDIDNPYSNGKDSTTSAKDTFNYRTIQGLHAGLFKPTCANSGCHDGNFEPDFRTVESSYYSLVKQPVIKKDNGSLFSMRVIPGNSSKSMLLHRMMVDLNGNSGIMPLSLEANSNYPVEKDSWVSRVKDWIDAGAKDWLGRAPVNIDFPPQILGLQFIVNGQVLNRSGKYEAAQLPAGSTAEIWVSLSDDNTPVSSFSNVTINASTDPNVFNPANEIPLKKGPSRTMAGLFSASNDYYWNGVYDGSKNIENDVVWFRITVSDSKNVGYQIPNSNSMFLLKTHFALMFK
jgi:hypothetical protein